MNPSPSPQQPSSYSRRVLLAVSGLSPQIVTETLYALAVADTGASRFVPTEIRLVTTREGAHRARLALLSEEPGWFHRLRREHALPEIAFGEAQIHVLSDAAGALLDDIRTPADNLRCADVIADLVRSLTADPACALHVSIAGGRKTMGFYLGYALTLFGRPQDRLSHVLVADPFESSWDFFYPSRDSRVLQTRDGKLVDAATAEVVLASIPFFSLRHSLPAPLLTGQASFADTVEAAQSVLAPPELLIDLDSRRVRAGGRALQLAPAQLALLAVFARRLLQDGGEPLATPLKGVGHDDWGRRYLAELRRIVGTLGVSELTERALSDGMDGDFYATTLSRLHRAMREQLGPAAAPYLVRSGGRRGRMLGQLALPAEAVRFTALPTDGQPL